MKKLLTGYIAIGLVVLAWKYSTSSEVDKNGPGAQFAMLLIVFLWPITIFRELSGRL